jgi:uncharacterized membrane protein YjdF
MALQAQSELLWLGSGLALLLILSSYECSRSHLNRVDHFTQGFVPAILAREILLRQLRMN